MDNPIPETIKIKSWKKVLGFPLSKRRSIMDSSQAEEFFLAKHGGLLKGKKAELLSRYVFRFVLFVFLRTCVDMTFSSSSSLQSPVLSRSS